MYQIITGSKVTQMSKVSQVEDKHNDNKFECLKIIQNLKYVGS